MAANKMNVRLINKKVSALIQATYRSELFPGKSMMQIAGKTVLDHVVSRIKTVGCISEIILATSTAVQDDPLADEARKLGVKVYRGSESDVITRLYEAVRDSTNETILKINGNYPLFDPSLAADLIREHIRGKYDFSYNEHLNGTLYGTGCEAVQKRILYKLYKQKLTPEQKEAGTLYFHQSGTEYEINKFPYPNPRPHYKVCFDTEKDLKLIEFIFKKINNPDAGAIIDLLDDNPILAESNRYEPVREVGLDKLYLFPEKIASLQNGGFEGTDYAYPISVELSLTNRCNFSCVWCSDKGLRGRLAGDLDFEKLKRLLADLKKGGTKGIVIEGGGEPTLYRNFDETVKHIYGMGFGVGLITNGSIPLKKDTLNMFEWIRVSLDASNAGEQWRLKKTKSFEKVMSNIKSFCSGNGTVGVGYVVTSQNMGNPESLIMRLRDFGVNYIQFRPVIDHPELDARIDLSYLKRYENNKFSVITEGMRNNFVEGNSGLSCRAHSLTTVITADGGVYLCGRLNIHEWFEPIGNINTTSFRDIWYGEKRRQQSQTVLDREFCKKHCPRCRLAKFNQLLDRLNKIKTRNFI